MYELTDSAIKKRMVEAIKNGLFEVKEEKRRKTGLIDNAIYIEKSDKIANSLVAEFQSDESYRFALCPRGRFTVLFVYHIDTKTIYSFFKEERFSFLMSRKSIENPHYIDTLLEFNSEFERIQMVIDEELFGRNILVEDKKQELKAKIVTMLDNDEPERYISVCYSTDGFRLCTVRAVITSKYLEIIDQNDWSELIEVDYSEAEFDDTPKSVLDYSLNITLKPNLANTHKNSDEINIPVKKIEKKKSYSLEK